MILGEQRRPRLAEHQRDGRLAAALGPDEERGDAAHRRGRRMQVVPMVERQQLVEHHHQRVKEERPRLGGTFDREKALARRRSAAVAFARPRFAHPQMHDAVVDLDQSLERAAHQGQARHAQQRELLWPLVKEVQHEVDLRSSRHRRRRLPHLPRAQTEELLDRVEMDGGLVAHLDAEAAEPQEGLLERRGVDAELVLELGARALELGGLPRHAALGSSRDVTRESVRLGGDPARHSGHPPRHRRGGAFLVLAQRPQLALEHRGAAQQVEIGQPIGRRERCRRGDDRAPPTSAGNRSSLRVRTRKSARLLTQILRVPSSSRAAKKASHDSTPSDFEQHAEDSRRTSARWSGRSGCRCGARASGAAAHARPTGRRTRRRGPPPALGYPTTASRRSEGAVHAQRVMQLDADAVEVELDLMNVLERRRVRVVARRAALEAAALEQLARRRGRARAAPRRRGRRWRADRRSRSSAARTAVP